MLRECVCVCVCVMGQTVLFTPEKMHVYTHAQNNREEGEKKGICLGIWNAKLVLFYTLGERYNNNECGAISHHL